MDMTAPILVLIISIADKIIARLIVGGKRKSISKTDGKYIQMFGLFTIGIIALCCVPVASERNDMGWLWLCLLLLVLGLQSFLEWKYIKNSKEYVVSLILLAIGLTYVFIFMF